MNTCSLNLFQILKLTSSHIIFQLFICKQNLRNTTLTKFSKYLVITSLPVRLTSLIKMLGEGGGKSNWTLRLLRRVEMFDWTGTFGEKHSSDPTDTSQPR